jgi:hypothetical protein
MAAIVRVTMASAAISAPGSAADVDHGRRGGVGHRLVDQGWSDLHAKAERNEADTDGDLHLAHRGGRRRERDGGNDH